MASAGHGAVRGKRQNKRVQPEPANPNELVRLEVRVPAEVRAKTRADAARLNLSLAAYVELALRQVVLEDLGIPIPLPLSESA